MPPDLIEHLSNLGIAPFLPDDPVDIPTLFMELTTLKAPDDYLAFLETFPRTSIFEKECGFPVIAPGASEGHENLAVLFGACSRPTDNLMNVRADYLQYVPAKFLVIGEATLHLVCLDLTAGSVFIFEQNAPGSFSKNLYPVASSFTEFLTVLVDLPETSSSKANVIGLQLSDELRRKAEEWKKNRRGNGV